MRTKADARTRTSAPPLRSFLVGGDRRSIARSREARALLASPDRVRELASLAYDENWLVSQRALDLLEKVAREHPEWVEPHKKVFLSPLAESDKWEVRLQIVRALPLLRWTPRERERVIQILRSNLKFPQTFVRAWALDSLASFADKSGPLASEVRRTLREFERSDSKALQARARQIRSRLEQ
jgi:HEAT repeat protein